MMKYGKMYKFGTVILAKVQYTDTFEIKLRPAVVLFEEYGNIVCAAITSNPHMKGITLTKEDGAVKNSVIKINYIFTISCEMIEKVLFSLSLEKRKIIKDELMSRLRV